LSENQKPKNKPNQKRRMKMQTFKQQYLCLNAQTYRIEVEDEKTKVKTGEIIEGITIRYIPTDDLSPQEDATALERKQISRGVKAAKLSMPLSNAHQLKEFPAIYDCEMELAVVGDKQQVRIRNINHVANVSLQKVPVKG
jgi:hypothetical protein